jgi:hypothetical protein
MFTPQQLAVVSFCADECVRQRTGPEAVAWMVNAYQYANSVLRPLLAQGGKLEEEHILTLAAMIEPEANRNGFRICDVRFKGETVLDDVVLDNQQLIPNQINGLLRVQDTATPAEFYQEYEEIHPCKDGNGREGAILFNLLGGTLDNPVVPPHFHRGRANYRSSFGEVES